MKKFKEFFKTTMGWKPQSEGAMRDGPSVAGDIHKMADGMDALAASTRKAFDAPTAAPTPAPAPTPDASLSTTVTGQLNKMMGR